jgi:hypothetical protein
MRITLLTYRTVCASLCRVSDGQSTRKVRSVLRHHLRTWPMNPNVDSFAYRPTGAHGLFDSICTTCAATVGRNSSISTFAELERQHVCDPEILAHRGLGVNCVVPLLGRNSQPDDDSVDDNSSCQGWPGTAERVLGRMIIPKKKPATREGKEGQNRALMLALRAKNYSPATTRWLSLWQ